MDTLYIDNGTNGSFRLDIGHSASGEPQVFPGAWKNPGGPVLYRENVEKIRDWLNDFLEEAQPKLPTAPYTVIDGTVDYGSGPFVHRLVLIVDKVEGPWWYDQAANAHSADAIKSFTMVREGLAV